MIDHGSKRASILIFAAVAVIFVISTIFLLLNAETDSNFVTITVDGRLAEKIDLSKAVDRSFRLETDDGYNVISIKNGRISIIEADCPDKKCVAMGELKSDILPIVCLPHKLMISFTEE